MNIFDEQMQMIKSLGYKFYDPKLFEKEFSLNKKERLFQLVAMNGSSVHFQISDNLSDSNRGFGGFGSTGK